LWLHIVDTAASKIRAFWRWKQQILLCLCVYQGTGRQNYVYRNFVCVPSLSQLNYIKLLFCPTESYIMTVRHSTSS